MFHFINENDLADRFLVWGNSLLGKLSKLSKRLVERFSWQEAQATWFVLTGYAPGFELTRYVPAVPPVRIRYRLEEDEHFRRGEVILTLSPWLSPETGAESYRSVQRRILGASRSRQLETKNLKLLRFVLEELAARKANSAKLTRAERRKLGKPLVEAWDQDNRPWAYGKHTGHFWRDYDNTRKSVIKPEYRRPRQLRSDRNGSSSGSNRGGTRR